MLETIHRYQKLIALQLLVFSILVAIIIIMGVITYNNTTYAEYMKEGKETQQDLGGSTEQFFRQFQKQ